MSYGIWASQLAAIGSVCEDARHHDEHGNVVGHDTTHGQAGYDLGLNYDQLEDLIAQIHDHHVRPGSVTRLAIHCHGLQGGFAQIEGPSRDALTNDSLANFQYRIERLRDYLTEGATVMFAGCLLAQRDEGSRLVSRLSEDSYFRNCLVVGFTRIGANYDQNRASTWLGGNPHCTEPGMRVTEFADVDLSNSHDLSGQALPWASEFAPHRKTAMHGRITYDWDATMDRIRRYGPLTDAPEIAGFRYSPPPQRNPGRLHHYHAPSHPHQGHGNFRHSGPLGS